MDLICATGNGIAISAIEKRIENIGIVYGSYKRILGGPRRKSRSKRKKRPHGRGYVYFIQADIGNEIKIGFSKTPMKRLRQLQTAAHRDLHLLAIMDGDMNLEHVIHARFAQYRTVGEWFKPAPEILDLCRRHATMDGSLQLAI